MSSINKVQIIGNLGEDPQIRYTQSNVAVANLSIATTEKYKKDNEWKEKTEWHKVVLWDRLAEICQEYLRKGSKVYIEGQLQTRKWEDKEGNTKYTTEIRGYKMLMLDSKGESNAPSKQANDSLNDSMPDMDDVDDSLPF